jgi:very-short-patch-repair endonuclease
MWNAVRNKRILGAYFEHHHVYRHLILHFYCARARLAILVRPDGLKWSRQEQVDYCESRGVAVLRFSETEVLERFDWVMRIVWGVVKDRLPHIPESKNASLEVSTIASSRNDVSKEQADISTGAGSASEDDTSGRVAMSSEGEGRTTNVIEVEFAGRASRGSGPESQGNGASSLGAPYNHTSEGRFATASACEPASRQTSNSTNARTRGMSMRRDVRSWTSALPGVAAVLVTAGLVLFRLRDADS